MKKLFIVGDTHFPFVHQPTLGWIYAQIRKLQPDYVIQIGDLFDYFSMGRFPRNHSVMTPEDEVESGYGMACEFWKTIKLIAPQASFLQMMGNHCARPIKNARENAPSLEPFVQRGIKGLFTFEGVHTEFNGREIISIDGASLHHGYKTKIGDHMKEWGKNAIVGHSHRGGVFFECMFRRRDSTLYELNAGYVGDPAQTAMQYTPTKCLKWTLGHGYRDADGVPMFIPYHKPLTKIKKGEELDHQLCLPMK